MRFSFNLEFERFARLQRYAGTDRLQLLKLPYLWNGQDIAGAGIYTDSLTSIITGCDSVSTLNLNVLPVYNGTLELTVCNSELPYLWNGQNIADAGVYTDSLTSIITGCDSVSTLNLNVLPVYNDTLELTVCNSELPYLWNGQDIAGAGVYTDSLTSIITGCDSVSTSEFERFAPLRGHTGFDGC